MRSVVGNSLHNAQVVISLPFLREEIREASRTVRDVRQATAVVSAHCILEKKKLKNIKDQIIDLESRTLEALAAKRDDLARQAAGVLVKLHREVLSLSQSVTVYEVEEARLREQLIVIEERLRDLDRGERVAKAKDIGNRVCGVNVLQTQGLENAENLLKKIQERQEIECMTRDAVMSLKFEEQTGSVCEKLADAGFGKSSHLGVETILEDLRRRSALHI